MLDFDEQFYVNELYKNKTKRTHKWLIYDIAYWLRHSFMSGLFFFLVVVDRYTMHINCVCISDYQADIHKCCFPFINIENGP